jgi:hypothetical protein
MDRRLDHSLGTQPPTQQTSIAEKKKIDPLLGYYWILLVCARFLGDFPVHFGQKRPQIPSLQVREFLHYKYGKKPLFLHYKYGFTSLQVRVDFLTSTGAKRPSAGARE